MNCPGQRFRNFAWMLLVLIAATSPSLCAGGADASPSMKSRPFRMGFTAFPHDITAEALQQTRRFVSTNADLIAHHIEGVPWAEALRNEAFPKEFLILDLRFAI